MFRFIGWPEIILADSVDNVVEVAELYQPDITKETVHRHGIFSVIPKAEIVMALPMLCVDQYVLLSPAEDVDIKVNANAFGFLRSQIPALRKQGVLYKLRLDYERVIYVQERVVQGLQNVRWQWYEPIIEEFLRNRDERLRSLQDELH